MTETPVRLTVGLLPVLLFLLALIYLDSYKLVRLRWILTTIALGCLVAGGSYLANIWLIPRLGLDPRIYSRYIAPLVEESARGSSSSISSAPTESDSSSTRRFTGSPSGRDLRSSRTCTIYRSSPQRT